MDFLQNHSNDLSISYFSLHSIGIFLTHTGNSKLFRIFMNYISDSNSILKILIIRYLDIVDFMNDWKLDYDDSYHFLLALSNEQSFVTLDKDFRKAESNISRIFLCSFTV